MRSTSYFIKENQKKVKMETKKHDSQIVKLRKALQNAQQKKKLIRDYSKDVYDPEHDVVSHQKQSQNFNCPLENQASQESIQTFQKTQLHVQSIVEMPQNQLSLSHNPSISEFNSQSLNKWSKEVKLGKE